MIFNLLFLTIIKVCSAESQSSELIFSPFHVAEYDLTSQSGTSITIKVAKQANLIAVACGLAGIVIIDGKTQKIQFQKIFEGEAVKGLAITSDGSYIMLGYQNNFSIFEYKKNKDNSYTLELVSQAVYVKGVIQDVIMNSKEDLAFAYGTQGSLVAYDIQNKANPQQKGAYFSTSAQVRRAVISNDDKFLYLADDVNGLVLLKIKEDPEFELLVASKGGSTWWQSWAVAVTTNKRYAYVMDNWDGIWISDLQNIYDVDEELYPVKIQYAKKFWPYLSPSVYSCIITNDDSYLLIGHRSQGVQIIDIRDKLNPVHYLTIQSEAVGFDIRLSIDENYLYYANAKSIIIFSQSIPNLNNQFPNLFNQHQTSIDWFSNTKYMWKCAVSKNDKYFYGFFNDDGLYIMDATNPYHMQFQSRIMPDPHMSIDMAALRGDDLIYMGAASSPSVVYLYDISDKKNPKFVADSKYNGNTDADGLYFNSDYSLLAVSNYSGILLFDTSDPLQLNLISEWLTPSSIFGSCKDVVLSDDAKYAIGAVRGYGLFVLDIQYRKKPELKFTLQTSGAEGMKISLNKQFLYVFDGFRGLTIVDITNLPNLTIKSRLQLTGWSNHVDQMYEDQFLIVVTFENGQLSLINIQDVSNPILVSKYDSKLEAALGFCSTNDKNYGYIITDKGVRTIPLKSSITIHTQISQVIYQSIGKPILVSLSKDQNILVGQTIQFNFIIVRPIISMAILDVYYYDKYEVKPLPYWMNYQSSSQSLTITVVKEGLGDTWTKPTLNTVVIKSAVPLTGSSFVYNEDVITTPEQGVLIWKYLLSIYLIDSNNFVTSFFDHNQPLNFNIPGVNIDNMSRLFELVKLTLMRGIYYNPILFNIAPSLSLVVSDAKEPIKTTSSSITFIMLVSEQTGKFVKQALAGVIVSYTDSQNQIKIEGSLDNVNAVLYQKLYFSLTKTTALKSVLITVIDGKNYDVAQSYSIDNLPFVSLNVPTKKGMEMQPQVNGYYPNGSMPIETDISISFSKNSFEDPDSPVLQFKLQVYQGGEYIDVPSDFFLQLSSTELKVSGKTKESQLNDKYELRIKASDGYSDAYNSFSVVVNQLPFIYVFNLLIKILGPIVGVLGIYKYKSSILNISMKKHTIYSEETAIVNQYYRKQITIMGNDLQRAIELYSQFKNKLIQKENLFAQEEREKRMYYNLDSVNTIKDDDFDKNDKNKNVMASETRRLKRIAVEDEKLTKTIYTLSMAPNHKPTNIFEKLYLRKDGSIAMTRMYRDMLQLEIAYSINAKTFHVKNDTKEFQNKESRFFRCLQGIVARDFITMDLKAKLIYDYMKYYAKKSYNYTQNDWYKAYVTIKQTLRNDKYDQQVPFADLELKDEVVNSILMDLNLNNQKGQTIESLQKLGINYNLIKLNLFCDALGITTETASTLKPSIGESLHLQFFQVHSVEAFKHIKNAWFMKLRECLGLDYMRYGMSKNMPLPHWLKFDQKNGVIVLEGTPAMCDVDELLIRVYDEDLYIVQHFMLKIVDEYNPEEKNIFEENFENSYILNPNDSIDLSQINKGGNTAGGESVREKNKMSQFRVQNSNRLIDQDSREFDKQIDGNNNNLNFGGSPQITQRIDQNDELFSAQNKNQVEDTSHRLMLDKDVSTLSQRNQQELVDRSQFDGDQSFIKMQTNNNQDQTTNQTNNLTQKSDNIFQQLKNKTVNYYS